MNEALQALLVGGGLATLLQLAKAKTGWDRWVTVLVAMALSSGTGYAVEGGAEAINYATAALATHSVIFSGTRVGEALKLNLLPRLLGVISEVAKNLSDAIGSKSIEGP